MKSIQVVCYAKINLCLDILAKRTDGYHELATVMQTIDLSDEVTLTKATALSVECDHPLVPNDSGNLAYKAAQTILDYGGVQGGADIKIKKKIPVAAGLAGGSANAAAVLMGLNILYDVKLPISKLVVMAKNIGADVPYCLLGGTVFAQGIGEKLSIIEQMEPYPVVLVKPPQEVSTKEVFSKVNLEELQGRPNTEGVIKAIAEKELENLSLAMGNVLEGITAAMIPEIASIKKEMLKLGAVAAQQCGSGPTVFALCSNKHTAEKIYSNFKDKYQETYICSIV